jgi:flagellar biogenesis protein FliO
MTGKMNQIWNFEFILRTTAKFVWPCSMFIFIAGQLTICFAQDLSSSSGCVQPSYYSKWSMPASVDARRLAQHPQEPNHSSSPLPFSALPPVDPRLMETCLGHSQSANQTNAEFIPAAPQAAESASPNPSAPADKLQSSFRDIASFVSNQFNKLLGRPSDATKGPDIKRMLGALSLVLGCYFGLVWLMGMWSPRSSRPLPPAIIEVLGKTPFGKGQYLQLVRLGSKLLLLLESNEGVQPIAEVSDPAEVHQLLSCCDPFSGSARKRKNNSASRGNLETLVHSFRIPSGDYLEPTNRLANHAGSPTLAEAIQIIEHATATAKSQPRYRNSYEA